MATEKRLVYLEDAIEKIVNFPSKVAQDAFYSKKQFTPMQILTVVTDRQHEIIDLLKQVKEVDAVEVVHGRWEDGECTACGFDIRDMIDGESEFRSWVWECVPYCPNCGAKMDGDGDG